MSDHTTEEKIGLHKYGRIHGRRSESYRMAAYAGYRGIAEVVGGLNWPIGEAELDGGLDVVGEVVVRVRPFFVIARSHLQCGK